MKRHAKAPSTRSTRRRVLVAISAALALVLVLGVSLANAIAPTVTVENATDVSYTSAKVKGTVDRQGQSTTYRFQYVTQASFEAEGWGNPYTGVEATLEEGAPGPQPVPGPGASDLAELTGLAPDTTYHLRLYAENADGSSSALAGSTFTTEFLATPAAATKPATDPSYTEATLRGEIDPNGGGSAINYFFEVSSDGGANWSHAGGKEITAEEIEGQRTDRGQRHAAVPGLVPQPRQRLPLPSQCLKRRRLGDEPRGPWPLPGVQNPRGRQTDRHPRPGHDLRCGKRVLHRRDQPQRPWARAPGSGFRHRMAL